MERNLDSGLDKNVEMQRNDDSRSKNPKTDKIIRDTAEKLRDNLK